MSIVKINNEQDTFYTIRTRVWVTMSSTVVGYRSFNAIFENKTNISDSHSPKRERVLHSERLKGEDGTLELATTQTNNTLTVIDSTYTDVVVRTNKTDLSELECINKMIAFG